MHEQPARDAPVLRRRRLTEVLGAILRKKMALITAPGGYGKTTLIRELVSELPGTAFCWLSLDPADASLALFLHQLARAALRHLPVGGLLGVMPEGSALAGSTDIRHLARLVAAEFEQHGDEQLIIVLDDIHLIDSSHEILTFLDGLIQSLPETVHIIAAGRSRPRLPLARLQTRGELILLTDRDLSFTQAEVAALFRESLGLKVPPDLLRRLQTQTEGWITALLLVGELLQGCPPAEWPRLVAPPVYGGALYDFLVEEVLAQQPSALQEFLLETCVLNTLEPVIIERMLGYASAGAILQGLVARNLFTLPLMEREGCYRYHHLFQAFLRRQLENRRGRAEALRLHLLAGQVYEGIGNLTEAVEHYLLAEQPERAIPLMTEQVDLLLKGMRQEMLRGWLERIPAHLHESDPGVLFLRAQMAGWLAQTEVLPLLYQRALELYEERGDYAGMARCLSAVTVRFWRIRHPYFQRAAAAWAQSPSPEVRAYGRILAALGLVAGVGPTEAFARLEEVLTGIPAGTRAYFACLESLAMLAFWSGDSAGVLKHGIPHTTGRTAMGDFTWGIYNWLSFCMLGDSMGLEEYHRQYMSMEVPPGMNRMHEMIGTLGQAIIHLYRGRWDDALTALESLRPYFNDRRSLLRTMGSEATFLAQSQMSRLYRRQGRTEEARGCLERNLELTVGYPEVTCLAHADMAEFQADAGDLAQAREHLCRAAAAAPPRLQGPSRISLELATARVAMAAGDPDGARSAIRRSMEVVWTHRSPWYLFFMGGPELLPLVEEVAREEPDLVKNLLGRLGEEALVLFQPALAHQEAHVRAAAAALIEGVRGASAPLAQPELRVISLGGFRVFRGQIPVETADWNRTRVRLLFLILLMRGGRPVAKEYLTQKLWPQSRQAAARTNLRATLHGLKRALEPGLQAGAESRFVLSDRANLWLGNPDRIRFDLWEFEVLVERARQCRRSGDMEGALAAQGKACSLMQGPFLPEIAFADHFQDIRTRTETHYLTGSLDLARHALGQRDFRMAGEYARQALRLDPALEEGYQVLIQSYLGRGDRERAEQTYRTCRRHLRKALGTEPQFQTRLLLEPGLG